MSLYPESWKEQPSSTLQSLRNRTHYPHLRAIADGMFWVLFGTLVIWNFGPGGFSSLSIIGAACANPVWLAVLLCTAIIGVGVWALALIGRFLGAMLHAGVDWLDLAVAKRLHDPENKQQAPLP